MKHPEPTCFIEGTSIIGGKQIKADRWIERMTDIQQRSSDPTLTLLDVYRHVSDVHTDSSIGQPTHKPDDSLTFHRNNITNQTKKQAVSHSLCFLNMLPCFFIWTKSEMLHLLVEMLHLLFTFSLAIGHTQSRQRFQTALFLPLILPYFKG
jgi:hypothetical protein